MKHFVNISRTKAGKFISALFIFVFFSFHFSSKATHIAGGDITVKSLVSNDFEVTVTLYRDCSPGTVPLDPGILLCVFDKVTNTKQQTFSMSLLSQVQLQLGNTGSTLCIEKGIYRDTINLPNNTNGYYLEWIRCCRNNIISNITNPGSSGNVFYTEIPDPALKNSTPTFVADPDFHMCINNLNLDNFTAVDIDNDSLVYSLVAPFDCTTNNICASPTSGCSPGPYGTVLWQSPYSAINMMGDFSQSINSQTGILSTTPQTQGVFVICVKVEEYRNGIKIGEIRRDMQYAVLYCVGTGIEENTLSVTSIFPNPSNDRIEVSFSDFVKGTLRMTDITGRELYSEKINANNVRVNVSALPVGYYTLSVVSETKTMREKIMIAR